ncbi:polycystic kidney disease protein 1-like 2 [Salmo salar]|uniref:Polycystic kidney disease protein 1-like 2 n=1 Tax=Salmo salar TaxID=8030 RepID=A0A1S3PSU3_SALSA|nr:polycystic kidney disease protein 1-like 2 [Salmo salar]|eukprot:XP_014030757.1 PREDICTED: polycystic kidney disease protein 1-like 2 [Salmo salar]
MDSTNLSVLLLNAFLLSLSCAEDEIAPLSCPEYQEGFDGSCYEFVGLPRSRSFLSAQGWCERGGGHLAFILNDETQQFLQKHLQPEQDWWLGLAPASPNLTLDSAAAAEGPLSWLDGSDVSYSNWVNDPDPGAGCGHILRSSGFQWEATNNCSQELHFICQFESGRSIACADHNATLQCGSGQVIEIDDSFYGRKTVHYCRTSPASSATSTQEECSWIDVVDSVTGDCHGLQACQATADVASFGEPCPGLGSYLSVEYNCKEGLHLLMSKLAAVFDNVSITVKWLLHPFQGNLTCTLSAGDGHNIDPYSPEELESSVVHKYTRPGVFMVGVECTTSEWHVTAQKAITIQEPIGEFGVIMCYSMNQSIDGANCKALYGSPLQIQVEVEAGTNVTYKIHRGEMLVANSLAVRGIVPHNITVGPEVEQQLGSGCHQLTLHASNGVSVLGVSTELQVCLLEPVEGLLGSVMAEEGECPDSDLYVRVSLDRGAPVQLLFQVSGANGSISETRDMQNRSTQVYNISTTIQGALQVKVRAWNVFSHMDVDVGNTAAVCHNKSDFQTEEHKRLPRANVEITSDPESPSDFTQSVTLGLTGLSGVPGISEPGIQLQWECNEQCKCRDKTNQETHVITAACLPDPFIFYIYSFTVQKKNGPGAQVAKAEKCITVTPPEFTDVTISCSNCNPVNINNDVTLKLECTTAMSCPKVVWHVEDTRPLTGDLKHCYKTAKQRPLLHRIDGGNEYMVTSDNLKNAQSRSLNLNVIAYGKTTSGVAKYTIQIPGVATPAPVATNIPPATTLPAATTILPAVTTRPAATTIPLVATTLLAATTIAATTTVSVTVPEKTAPTTIANLHSCIISPQSGTVLDAFNITCATTSCSTGKCQYCFKTDKDKHLRCSYGNEVKSIFLPLGNKSYNYSLSVVVTLTNGDRKTNATITTEVWPANSSSSVENLQSVVENTVAQLQQQRLLTGETLGQMFKSVSDILNKDSSEDQKGAREELREQMLSTMTAVLKNVPNNTPQEVQLTARAVAGITKRREEVNSAAQLEASSLVADLSSSLLYMNVSEHGGEEMAQAATPIVDAASNILGVSSNASTQRKVSKILLNSMDNVQSALLNGKKVGQEPAIIKSPEISVYANRMSPNSIQMQSINIPDSSSASFSFPPLGADVLSPEEPVDVRMLSFEKNPYSWSEGGNISGAMGSVSLTRQDGSAIPVENLSEEIEILLPRLEGGQVNSTILDLGNYSTLMIDVPSPDITLVLKMEPSEDIPFVLLLGYKDYPKDKQYIAKTQMPHQGNSQERYTWVLGPNDLAGKVGVHYLVVRPIVVAGVKSVNATVTVTSIAAQCKYWNETLSTWSEDGCRVGHLTTPLVTQCLCNHLTFFGSSFFIMPNLVDVSRTAELFATFSDNPVVVCFVGAIFVAYLLVVMWARRKDIQDIAKVKVTLLEDNDPLAEYRYMLNISTGHRRGASTSSQVTVTLLGTEGESEPHHLTDPDKPVFERGAVDTFVLTTPFSLGELQSIRLWHDNSGGHPAWYVNKVTVQDLEIGQKWHFLCNSWLAIDMGECILDKVFPVASDIDLKKFSNLFFMKTAKDFRDGHIWFSVISRPPTSTFTCVQRVSCCFSLLLCTMLTSIMFWGIPTDPSEQTMDLGHIEFTWQQVMIGVQSSIIMFPINLLIVSIFRNTRPRETKPGKPKAEVSKQGKTGRVTPSQPPSPQRERELTPDTVIKDIKKIAQSLSKAMKSPIPCLELEMKPGPQTDINTLLSLVEDIIRQQNRAGGEFYTDASKKEGSLILSLGVANLQETSLCGSPDKTGDGRQKRSNNSQYLYRQLRHVEKELSLLGPSRFPNPDSYCRAVQQVQGMRGLLESHLSSSSLGGDQLSQSPSPAESSEGDSSSKKQGGLPWWFVFIGWILVLATSGVSGYFTMMYGLTYGKDRSISWLISMVVSFFESLFITQPLKVLGFAAFFALVLKKVDQEEYGDAKFEGELRNPDDPDVVRAVRRDSTCSFYQPPPPTDIERMRSNMIKEQKVFALIKEILTYMGFMWMLLLVAYGQRDPNAYLLTQHIRQSFSQGISDSMSHKDVFTWANTSLLSNLFGEYPGFITDGNSKLVGNARLRQVRVQKNSCRIARSMRQAVPDCHAPYSWEVEDMGSYGPGWNRSASENTSKTLRSPWQYQTQARLRAQPIWGSVVLYRGGGFVVDLGPESQNASSTLQYLFDNTWLDMFTRAVFVEFTVYNANVNLFCTVTLMLETTAVGAFQFRSELQSVRLYQSTGGLHIFVMASEVIYFLFILYYMYVQGKLMKQQKWAYFKTKWNLLELAIILLSWSALSVFIKRTLLGNRDMEYYHNHKDQFASFHETATADAVLGYLIAFLVLLATVKLWHLLRLNPKLHMITATLQRAWTDISGFLVVITIMFLAYSIASYLMYGWKLYSYRTLLDAALTMVSLQLGIFNYDEVLDYNPVLGAFLIGSCIIFMTFVVLNLFISVILVAFTQEQIHHKPSEEEEVVDLMLMKLCSLFGIKMKEEKEDSPKENGMTASATNRGFSTISS